jgi:hypothetical protein
MVADLPPKLAVQLTEAELKIWRMPWYHTFSPLGLPAGGYQQELLAAHQLEKQGDIFRQTRDALSRFGRRRPKGVCLTSTDGLFGLYALTKGAAHVDIFGVTSFAEHDEPWHLEQTRIAAKLLNLKDRCTVEARDLEDIQGPYDFGICVGALYGFPDPTAVLVRLRTLISGPLVIHSHVYVTPDYEKRNKANRMAQLRREIRFHKDLTPEEISERQKELHELEMNKDRFYFESPASWRPWGSRFSHDTLITMAVDAGWTVINEKEGDILPKNHLDRGSSSLLCV